MAENMMNSSHKANSRAWLNNYDITFKKSKWVLIYDRSEINRFEIVEAYEGYDNEYNFRYFRKDNNDIISDTKIHDVFDSKETAEKELSFLNAWDVWA